METKRSCVDCGLQSCEAPERGYPDFCLTTALTEETVNKVKELYMDEENQKVSHISATIEEDFYCRYTRVEEVCEFAKRMGFHKIGIATCIGLVRESRILAKILRSRGFEVHSVVCKVGSFPKTLAGIEESYLKNTGLVMCNPIMQAMILNQEGTELNVVMGLCVGHDSLFYKYSDALVTTLVAKDRVLAHNPVGALYQAEDYYKKKLMPEE